MSEEKLLKHKFEHFAIDITHIKLAIKIVLYMWGDDKMPFRANGLLFIMFTSSIIER